MHYYLKSAIIECVLGEGRFSEIVQILQYDLHSYGEYDIL